MKAIKFDLAGFINSFRVSNYRTYHKTFLAPPKTTILGLVSNAMGLSELEHYKFLEKELEMSAIIKNIQGEIRTVWNFKNLKGSNRGRGQVYRERLYKSEYQIFLKVDDKRLLKKIKTGLTSPARFLSLGQSDELVKVKNVENIDLIKQEIDTIDSIFPNFDNVEYNSHITSSEEEVMPPREYKVHSSFEVEINSDSRNVRKPKDYVNLVEFYNCSLEFPQKIYGFKTPQKKNIVFY